MTARRERATVLFRALVHELREENITFMAGSIAYHAFVSIFPLLLLMLTVVSTLGNGSLESAFIGFTSTILTDQAGELLVEELRTAGTSTGVSVLGIVLLIWGTLRIFRGLDTAFSDIYESESENTFADQMVDGLLVLVTFSLALASGWAVDSILASLGDGPLIGILRRLVLIAGLMLTFLPMYYVFPDTDVSVREILPGVFVTSLGLVLFETLFRVYTQFKAPAGSVVSGILVLLTWLYFSGLVILLGAAVNAVLSNRSHDVNVTPLFGGIDPETSDHLATDRDQLVASLRGIEKDLHGAEELVVTIDGKEVPLPPPKRVSADFEESTLSLDDGTVGIELRWNP